MHEVLGHRNDNDVQQYCKLMGIDDRNAISSKQCATCAVTKSTRHSVSKHAERTQVPGKRIHADIVDWTADSPTGKRYSLVIVDEGSKLLHAVHLNAKKDAVAAFQSFLRETKLPISPTTTALQTDSDAIFLGADFQAIVKKHLKQHQQSPPYTQAQNGIVERQVRTLSDMVRAMITGAGLDASCWSLACNHALHILNNMPRPSLHGKTPLQIVTGSLPKHVPQLRVFGQPAVVHISTQRGRLQPKGRRGIYVGHNSSSNSHLVYFEDTNTVVSSIHVRFLPFSKADDVVDEGEEQVQTSTTSSMLQLPSARDSSNSTTDGEPPTVHIDEEQDEDVETDFLLTDFDADSGDTNDANYDPDTTDASDTEAGAFTASSTDVNAGQGWARLKDHYASQDRLRIAELKEAQLHVPCGNLARFFERHMELQQQLQDAGVRQDNEDLFTIVWKQLPRWTAPLTLPYFASGRFPSLLELSIRLQQLEQQMRGSRTQPQAGGFMASAPPRRGGRRGFSNNSNNHGRQGRNNGGGNGNSNSKGRRFRGNCHYCGKYGHRAAECRKKQRDNGATGFTAQAQHQHGQDAATFVAATATTPTQLHDPLTWLADTGASHHLTFVKDAFVELTPHLQQHHPRHITAFGGTRVPVRGVGSVLLHARTTSGAAMQIVLQECLYVPEGQAQPHRPRSSDQGQQRQANGPLAAPAGSPKGFSQRPGIDFDQTYAPTPAAKTILTVLAVSLQRQHQLHQLDFKSAYLQADLKEELYMKLPPHFTDIGDGAQRYAGKVCRLLKPLYGLKQAGRAWAKKLHTFLKTNGWAQSNVDACLFTKLHDDGQRTWIITYVDDLIISGSSERHIHVSFACGLLCRYMDRYTTVHWQAAKHVVRYLKATSEHGLLFKRRSGTRKDQPLDLVCYSDASFGTDQLTGRSTTGFTCYINGCLVSWSSRLQPTVALSTAEAEYMAISAAAQDVVFLRQLLMDLDEPEAGATKMLTDNQAAIAIGNDHVTKPRTKHIRVRHHFVRELIADGTIVLQHCPGTRMVADALTKALDKQTFEQHLPRLVGTSTAETEQRKAVEGEC
ncbi:hypothetical protein PTSG_12181 [Salpingoeca rosetta]|uniref:Integrase catalytic domain-containing protein n=1 Tax=Salpingoeca rosetta (strain ATCC 50818 / BSB-021) TaxID=946362 RepID=F2U8R5_SALR5|nr:uncharacterized protein PTSG_12181 [Salpingoeca rosetta]EGD72773.1 hypothetical protein PTSG_12181 [Salpingoeca rosetta]|eukprot:XP_004994596.1 hypothetical protein PTSG_12181 [Salpingoeca rosetta]